ncbi:SufS family cysteine desulfurase [Miltoncostaea oceani]|uniref:aminotransferase class V-fold PLP-dependent enzyme n=1 Tax=Miltoncostaea oceani TaxID=2843216 RepID=UPI001C3D0A75
MTAVGTAATIDVPAVRADFPILGRRVHDAPLVYLDSAATSQKPSSVLAAMDAYYRETNANVHRGVYELAAEATARFEAGRDAVARLVGSPREGVILTKNASEAINLVAWAWGVRTLVPGDEIVVTEMEHHSGIVPWQIVAGITGATVRFVPVTPGGELDMDAARALIGGGRVKMVGVVHASNVLGTINPVAEIAALAHEAGALCLVDASQSVPHMPVDFASLGCDFMAFTGHKMLGPTGIGVLVGRPEVLDAMEPFLGGGEMISDVSTSGSTWADLPWKFEAGTPPIAEAVGLGAAAEYLMAVGLDAVRAHEVDLTAHMLDALAGIRGLTVYGPRDPAARGGAVSFSMDDLHPHDIAQLIDQDGVCVRAGHHCAKPLMRVLGVGATARASTYLYNSHDDIDALVRALHAARAAFA